MNRRNLLTAAAASVMLPGAVEAAVQPQPDAELITACSEYLRIQREFEAYYDTLPGDIEAGDPGLSILDQAPALVETIVALRATTAEGHLARARCMAFFYLPGNSACRDNPEGATEDRFEAALLRDLVSMERGPA